MNVPAGNGTFTTAASAGNTGTGVIDTGSVTMRDLEAAVRCRGPYTITFTDATDYTVTDASGNAVTTRHLRRSQRRRRRLRRHRGRHHRRAGRRGYFHGVARGPQSVFDYARQSRQLRSTTPAARAAARAQLSSQLGGSLQQIDQALDQVSTVTTNVGSRISLISSVNNALTSAATTVARRRFPISATWTTPRPPPSTARNTSPCRRPSSRTPPSISSRCSSTYE